MDRAKKLLKELGATLKRSKKHLVYELPNGRNVVVSSTPSDSYHGEQNKIRDIKHAAGLTTEPKPEREPRERRHKPGRRDGEWSLPVISPMAEAMQSSGLADRLVEMQLRRDLQEAEAKIANLRRVLFEREQEIIQLRRSWYQRVIRWFQKQIQ